jgi:hypothetical protein
MRGEKAIVRTLDLITLGGVESLSGEAAKRTVKLRRLLKTSHIVGIGVAEKQTDHRATGTLALCFYVDRKLPLTRLSAAEAVPEEIPSLGDDGKPIRTDVVVLGKLKLEKTLRPGASISNVKGTAGTIGALVRRAGKVELLSNAHVLALSGKGKLGSPILSPGIGDGGKSPRDIVAKLSKVVRFAKGGAFTNLVDCATARPSPEHAAALDPSIPGIGLLKGVVAAKRGMKILKTGLSTGTTTGTVRDVHFRFSLDYDGVGRVGFLDQVLCTRYSSFGDSGSLVVDKASKRAVGLHFAGAPQGSVFNPIQAVLDELGAELVTKPLED